MPLMSTEEVQLMLRWPAGSGEGPKMNGTPALPKGQLPVLVDFANSVIEEPDSSQAVASKVGRPAYRGPARLVKRLLSPRKQATLRNVDRFISALKAAAAQPRVLVVGGGSIGQGLEQLYGDPDIAIAAFDIYQTPNIHFVADAHDMPLADSVFAGVVVQAVLEHVLEPPRVAAEIFRVLKPGGLVYAETPFMQQVHEGAYDFTRFTESGHRYLFRAFERIDSGPCGGPGIQFMWSVDFLARGLFRSRTAGRLAKLLVFWVQYLDRLIPESYAVDGASGVFFLGRKSGRAIGPKEAIAHYRGAQKP